MFPPILPFFIMLALILFLLPLLFIIFIGSVTLVFHKLGIPFFLAYILFWFSLIGSFINIPIKKIESYIPINKFKKGSFFGLVYPISYIEEQKTTIAINVGGALIPVLIVFYEIIRLLVAKMYPLLLQSFLATIIVLTICYFFSKPVKGLGIGIPVLIPPIFAAISAWVLAPQNPAVAAYISGVLGTLIGADLLKINKIKELGAPIASIGGAGTFDGIFITGIVAVLLV